MFNANLVNSIRWIVAVYRNRPSNFARGLSGKKENWPIDRGYMNFARFPFRSYGRRRGSTESRLKVGRLLRRNSDTAPIEFLRHVRCTFAQRRAQRCCFSCFILLRIAIQKRFVASSTAMRDQFHLIRSCLMDEERFVNHYVYRYAWYNKRSQSTIFIYNLLKLLRCGTSISFFL